MMNFNITIVKNDDFKTVGFPTFMQKRNKSFLGDVQVICITTRKSP